MLKVIQPSLSDSTRRNTVQQVVCTALSHSSPLASIHGHVFFSKGKSIHMMSISTALAMLHSGLGDQGYYTSFPAYHHFCETPGPRCTREIRLKPRVTVTGQSWAVSTWTPFISLSQILSSFLPKFSKLIVLAHMSIFTWECRSSWVFPWQGFIVHQSVQEIT